jgi:hypothetical protein
MLGNYNTERRKTVTIDEEFQKLIPPLTDDEYRQLEENCIKEGIREAILVWDRGDDLVIVDGHNRYQIAREHNLKWNHKVMNFESREEAKIWIVKNQLGRRNLLPQVRALLALKVEPEIGRIAEKNLHLSGGKGCQKSDKVKPIDTKKELAQIAGVSHDTIHKIKKIEAEATPHIKELLYSGTITTNQAYNTTFPKTLNPVKEATKEHEEYQEKLKSGVVDINEAKKDKTNQDILYNGFMVELYKVLRTVTGFGMMYTYKDIDKHTKKIPQQESEDLILKLDAVIGVLDYVRTEIERSNNERN